MKLRLHIILLFFSSILFFMPALQAQVKKAAVVKSAAYFKVNIPGTIMVDENGNPMPVRRDTFHMAVFEIGAKSKMEIDSVFFKGNNCSFSIEKYNDTKSLGKFMRTGKQAGWQVKKGNIVLIVGFRNDNSKTAEINTAKSLIQIKTHTGTRTSSYSFLLETQLEPDLSM